MNLKINEDNVVELWESKQISKREVEIFLFNNLIQDIFISFYLWALWLYVVLENINF